MLVCVLIAIFPIIADTLFGQRSVAGHHHDLFTLHHAGRLTRLVKLQIPSVELASRWGPGTPVGLCQAPPSLLPIDVPR